MARYGLVFKIGDQCWLAEYQVDGAIEDASFIDDNEGIYADLNPKELSLVEIELLGDVDAGEQVTLRDVKTISVENEDPELTIQDLLEDGGLPTVAKSIFESEELIL